MIETTECGVYVYWYSHCMKYCIYLHIFFSSFPRVSETKQD
jgi:hypothetical protein